MNYIQLQIDFWSTLKEKVSKKVQEHIHIGVKSFSKVLIYSSIRIVTACQTILSESV